MSFLTSYRLSRFVSRSFNVTYLVERGTNRLGLFKNMIKNEILSAISVNLIKMVILGVGQDGGWYYVVLITIFCLFLTDSWCSVLPPEGDFGTRQLYKFTLVWDHLTITIIGRMMHPCNFFLLASAIEVSWGICDGIFHQRSQGTM